jgi:hypothetical protein
LRWLRRLLEEDDRLTLEETALAKRPADFTRGGRWFDTSRAHSQPHGCAGTAWLRGSCVTEVPPMRTACVHRCVHGDIASVGNESKRASQLGVRPEESSPLDLAGDQIVRPVEDRLSQFERLSA